MSALALASPRFALRGAAAEARIRLSFFENLRAVQPRNAGLPWQELRECLTRHAGVAVDVSAEAAPDTLRARLDAAKRAGRAFSPALYRAGATRGNAGVETVTCYVADIDDGTPLEALRGRWEGIAWAAYSTFKSRAHAPRYRIVFPLAAPVPAAEWPRVWRKLTYHLTDNHSDPATKDAGRLHLLPACPAAWLDEAFADFQDGDFLDPDQYADPPPDPQQVEREAARARRFQEWRTSASDSREGEKPGAAFNRQAGQGDLLDLLTGAGWEEDSRRGGLVYLRRPGKAQGVSGLLGFEDAPTLFYCFSSNAPPLAGGRLYDPFGLFTALKHGGDFEAAFHALGRAGYGQYEPVEEFQQRLRREREAAAAFARRVEERAAAGRVADTGQDKSLADYQKTDAGNAEMLVHRHGENLRYCPALGWRRWNGRHWEAGEESLLRLARQTVRAMLGQAADLLKQAQQSEGDAERRLLTARAETLLRHANRSESAPRLQAMVTLAASFEEVETDPAAFELRPWMVPFVNGVWDRGEFRPHRREDWTETLLPVAYDPGADGAEWLALLSRITGGDAALAKTLQQVAGYALSGASTLRLLPWLYGPKGTGKSTFAELLLTALGEAGRTLDASLLSGQREEEHLGAAVRGARALFLPEAGTRRLDGEILKRLAGSDRIAGRYRYARNGFNVSPTWALVATSNDAPNLSAYDEALRDRLVALPFVHALDAGPRLAFTGGRRLEEVRRDPGSALVGGFVAWAVEGLCQVYEAQEVYRAPVTVAHTRRFWSDADTLTPFWETIEGARVRAGLPAGELRALYLAWTNTEGVRAVGSKTWGAACRAVGLEEWRRGEARGWRLPPASAWVNEDEAAL